MEALTLKKTIEVLVTSLIYLLAVGIAITLLFKNPTSPYRAVPLVAAVGLLAHALTNDTLRAMGYAVGGLFGVVAVLLLVAIAAAAFGPVPFLDVVTSDAVISVLLAVVLALFYVAGLRRLEPNF